MTDVTGGTPYRPWFQRWPRGTTAVTALLFIGITILRIALGDDATTGVTMLYTLPIALAALAWGRWAGVVAATVAIALFVLWVLVDQVDLTLLGWSSRVVPMLLVGSVLGDASVRLRRAGEERRRFEAHELLRRQAIEINDSLVQRMAAAKWALEAGRTEAGIHTLDEALVSGQELVSDLIRDSDMGPGRSASQGPPGGSPPGTIEPPGA